MAETTFATPWGSFELHRGTTPADSPLRAWSAADRIVVDELAARSDELGRVLLVNDAWGAVSVPLAGTQPTLWNDSARALSAIAANHDRNGLAKPLDRIITGDRTPTGPFDTVVILVPKSIALLSWQARVAAAALAPGGRMLVAGMSKHLTSGVFEALERSAGQPQARRAIGKARIIDIIEPSAEPIEGPATSKAFVTAEGIEVHEAPGVFSAGHLDVGTALLLNHLTDDLVRPSDHIADLGCGNGVIAATLSARSPDQRVDAIDVSYLAASAARATRAANALRNDRFHVHVADGFDPALVEADGAVGADEPVPGRFDVIVTNPPFHQDRAVDAALTDGLLGDAVSRLNDRGRIVVVAQRHLEMHRRLHRWCSNVRAVSGHPTHVVLVGER